MADIKYTKKDSDFFKSMVEDFEKQEKKDAFCIFIAGDRANLFKYGDGVDLMTKLARSLTDCDRTFLLMLTTAIEIAKSGIFKNHGHKKSNADDTDESQQV